MNTNILIVDDNENNLYTLEKTIMSYLNDVSIIIAQSGEEALQLALSSQIDLIILDIQMPHLDGFDVAKYLEINPKTKHIPIIFLTAVFVADEFVTRGFALGAIDYLIKPIDDTKLISQINLYKRIFNKERQSKVLEAKVKEATHKRLEQERLLFEQSKMITMGEMMSNIAHQWRQPLTAVVNTIDYIQMLSSNDTISPDELSSELDNIAQSAIFLSETINTFRNFFEIGKSVSEYDVSVSIQDTLLLIDKNIKHYNIRIEKDIQHITIKGYKQELQHALLNIINNAKDALAECSTIKHKVIWIKTIDNIDSVSIIICDNGGGISQEIMSSIFEPYYTTKQHQQSTGIGLYMTHQLITTNMKGSIHISNIKQIYNEQEYMCAMFDITIPKNQNY